MASAPESASEFTATQQEGILDFARAMLNTGGAFLILGALWAVAGIYTVFAVGFWAGLLLVLQGALTAFVGIALATGSTDARYLVETKGCEKDHLANTLISVNAAYVALTIFGGLGSLVLVFRLFM